LRRDATTVPGPKTVPSHETHETREASTMSASCSVRVHELNVDIGIRVTLKGSITPIRGLRHR
jgi:hypothetical protein